MTSNDNVEAPQPAEPEPQTIEPENRGDQPEPQTVAPEVEEEQYADDVYADEEDENSTGPIIERPLHEEDPDEDLSDDDFEEFDK